MSRKNRFGKRMITYVLASALAVSAGFLGSGMNSQAASYIQYDNIIIRDDANGNILGGISKGTEVEIIESKTGSDGKTWDHVRYASNGTTSEGWVRSDLITDDRSQVEDNEDTPDEEPADADNAGQDNETSGEGTVSGSVDGADQSADVSAISGDGYLPNGDNTFDVQGKTLTISDDFDSDQMPEDFEKTEITYNGNTVSALKYAMGDVFLLYLTDDDGNGDFYVLDTQQNCVVSFIRLDAGGASLILLLPPVDTQISDSYGKTVFAVDDSNGITAYQYNQDVSTLKADIVLGEYYYVYGISRDGIMGWYLYDNGGNTFIRATTDLSADLNQAEKVEEKPASDGSSLDKMIIVGLAALCVLLFVLTIIFGARSRSARKYIPEEEYEDEEEVMTRAERRREERKYRRFMEEDNDEEAYIDEDREEICKPAGKDLPDEEQITSQTVGEGWKSKTDDYDVEIPDTEDYDLLDENEPEDEREYDELEKMLMAGLEDAMKAEKQRQERMASSEVQPGQAEKTENVDSRSKEDEWDDELEFLDL